MNLIRAKLDTLNYYFALGYALPRIEPAATRHALMLVVGREYSQWAGVPIISVGNAQRVTEEPEHDYPPSLRLSAVELRELRLGLAPPWQARTFEPLPASLYMIAAQRYDFAPGVVGARPKRSKRATWRRAAVVPLLRTRCRRRRCSR